MEYIEITDMSDEELAELLIGDDMFADVLDGDEIINLIEVEESQSTFDSDEYENGNGKKAEYPFGNQHVD